jgi:TolB-like protein
VRRIIDKRSSSPAETRPPPPLAPQPPKPALALPTKPSVAVRPFSNLVGDDDHDYFADGMVVEIITALSRFRSLFVISAGSTLSYRGDTRASTVIARELGVRFILQGTVPKSGQQVRIAVELLDEVGLSPIWTQRFDGSLDDIFALQDMISATVASQIEPSIKASEVARAANQQSPSNSAYDLYLRGTQAYWESWTKDSLSCASDLFKKAVALDPSFALAQVYASSALINFVLLGHADDAGPMMKLSVDFARAAVRVGQHDAEALSLAAYTLFQCDQPLEQIDELLQRSLDINPGISICHYNAGYIHV